MEPQATHEAEADLAAGSSAAIVRRTLGFAGLRFATSKAALELASDKHARRSDSTCASREMK